MATNLLIIPFVQMTVEVFTNEDWHDALAFYDPDGNPILLTGISFALEARHHVEDATALISISNIPPDKTIVIDGNIFHIMVPLEKMSRVPRGEYVFDAVGNADGNQRVIMTGVLTVIEGVTR